MWRTVETSVLQHLRIWTLALVALVGTAAWGATDGAQQPGGIQSASNKSDPDLLPKGEWNLVDLGMPAAISSTTPFSSTAAGINDAGQIVGTFAVGGAFGDPNARYEAFLWKDGVMKGLGTMGGVNSHAFAISNSGVVVGSSQTNPAAGVNAPEEAFLLLEGFDMQLYMASLHNLPFPAENSAALGVNDFGTVVGSYVPRGDNQDLAFVYFNDLDQGYHLEETGRPGAIIGQAVAINASNQIAVNANGRAYRFDLHRDAMEGTVTDLGELANSPHTDEMGTYALALNNEIAPVIVGQSKGLAFRYKNGAMTRAGGLLTLNEAGVAVDVGKSIAYAINESGWIVGIVYARPGKPESVAFLDRDGETIDLNSLPDVSAAGWKLTEALGINNHGQIVGLGTNPQGQVRAFLLTPTDKLNILD